MTSGVSNKSFELQRLEGRERRGVYKQALDRRVDKAVDEIHRTAMSSQAVDKVHQEVIEKVEKDHRKIIKKVEKDHQKGIKKIHDLGDAHIKPMHDSKNLSDIE